MTPSCWFQPFPVTAVDRSKRPLTSQPNANLLLQVTRNEHAPAFTERSYSVNIDRTQPENQPIATVQATDADTVVCYL